jgi:hypothetical protein
MAVAADSVNYECDDVNSSDLVVYGTTRTSHPASLFTPSATLMWKSPPRRLS